MTDDMPIVTRRDMLGETCLVCEGGKYRTLWGVHGSSPSSAVACGKCGTVTQRWLTKREILKLRIGNEEQNG